MIKPTVAFIEQLAAHLTTEDRLTLIERLARRTKLSLSRPTDDAKKPVSLRGIWKDKFPEDFDIDAVLKEIRSEWLKELDEMEEA